MTVMDAVPSDPKLAAIAGRVRAEVGPAAEFIAAAASALALLPDTADIADEISQIGKASVLLTDMVANCRPELVWEGSIEATNTRLRHDLRTPLVALKGYGELVMEIAAEDGAAEIAAAVGHLLEGVAKVMVAIEMALPSLSRAQAAEDLAACEEMFAPALVGRVLVADDSKANRDVLVKHLTREGHEVVAVADGLAALDMVFEERFDLVLLDMIMPGMNGDEVLKSIKADPRLRTLPVIMISALDDFDAIIHCIEEGAEDYLPKPFNRVLLRARIGACLEKTRLREVELSYLRAVEKELTIARDVQQSILPKVFPAHHALIGHGLMDPAREIGGDFYDFFTLDDDRVGIAIGDVSGKGVPAAVYMAMVRTQLRATALFGLSPAECLSRLNEQLSADNAEGMFVSLFYGIIDCAKGLLTYANGGHNWPARLGADGSVTWIEGTDDLLVGVLYGGNYHDATLSLSSGDTVFLYTDGVVEAIDPAEDEFGKQRLASALADKAKAAPDALCNGILTAVRSFEAGLPHSDDLTCVAVRFLGRSDDSLRFEMQIASREDEIGRLVSALQAHFRRQTVTPEAAYPMTMAIEEVVAIIIRHGQAGSGAHFITVRVTVEDGWLRADVADDGASFDPTALGAGDPGMGLHLIRTMVEKIAYSREVGRNHLRLMKPLPLPRIPPA